MNWDTFAGMVPADNPQFVVAIMVDNPAHGLEGGDVAAPLFHEIATYELQHARHPADRVAVEARAAADLRPRPPATCTPVPCADVLVARDSSAGCECHVRRRCVRRRLAGR